ncbi:MAG: hypothetical protein ACRDKY_06425 [Solirubrobacteraceae bacterium]
MDPSQASLGEKIAGGSALVLLIALFLPWYGIKIEGLGASVSLDETGNAWELLSFVDILLFLAAAAAIALIAARLAGALPALPAPPSLIVLGAGALALALVLFRLIFTPEPDGLPEQIDLTRKFGIFVALLAAAGVAYGGSQMAQEQ